MWQELKMAFSFLTRLPVKNSENWDEAAFSRATRFYPLVGLVLGALAAAVAWVFAFVHPNLAALATIIAVIALSGGLHLDGYMDTCDGIFASRGRERALEIMKDSHVGAFGVIGVVVLLLSKYVLYGLIIGEGRFLAAIAVALVFSRWMLSIGLIYFPSARAEGLGVTVKRHVAKSSFLWGLVLLLLIALVSRGWLLLFVLALATLTMVVIASLISRFLGGLTGDVYGAMAELADPVFLLFFVIFAKICPGILALQLF